MENEKDILVLEKSNKTKWLLVILGLLVLSAGVAFYYLKYFNNPVYVMEKGLAKVYESYANIMNIDKNKPYRVHGNLELDIDTNDEEMQKVYDVVNNIDVLYDIDISEKDKLYNIEIDSKYLDSNLLNGKIINNNNKMYLYLEDLYDKYLYVETEDVDDDPLGSLNDDDYANILNGLKEAFAGSFVLEDFKREKATITDNNKEISVYKNYLVIDDTNYERIFKYVLTKLRDDEQFIASYNKALEEKNAKELIEESLNKLSTEEFDGKFEIIVYSRGYANRFVKLVVNIYEMDNLYNLEIGKKNKITINHSELGENIMTINIDMKMNNCQFNVTMGDLFDANLEKVTMNFGMIVENIASIEKIDESKVVNIEKLTDDELMGIYQKILQNEGFNRMIEDFSFGMESDLGISA